MMKGLSMELKQRIEEAGKDNKWIQKIRNAESMEKFTKLLEEKEIKLPVEVKEALDEKSIKNTGQLEDNDLEEVTGGWTNIFNCPREYSLLLCEYTFCPHKQTRDNTPDENHYDKYCDQGYWSNNWAYPQK